MFLKGLCEEGASLTYSPGKKPVSDLRWDGKHSQPARVDFGDADGPQRLTEALLPFWRHRQQRAEVWGERGRKKKSKDFFPRLLGKLANKNKPAAPAARSERRFGCVPRVIRGFIRGALYISADLKGAHLCRCPCWRWGLGGSQPAAEPRRGEKGTGSIPQLAWDGRLRAGLCGDGRASAEMRWASQPLPGLVGETRAVLLNWAQPNSRWGFAKGFASKPATSSESPRQRFVPFKPVFILLRQIQPRVSCVSLPVLAPNKRIMNVKLSPQDI